VVSNAPATRVIERLEDDAPLLLERELGRGRVYFWATTLGVGWSAMPVSSVFVPFVTRLALAAAAGREPRCNVNGGDMVMVPWPVAGAGVRLTPPSGLPTNVSSSAWGSRAAVMLSAPAAPGLYSLEGVSGVFTQAHFTVVGEVPESDLRPLDAAARSALCAALDAPIYDGWAAAVSALGPADASLPAWPWLLALMLAIYLAESWFVRKL
jgi:hypothetical protein